MQFNTIVTHDTTFHADEVIAIAMLRVAGYEFTVDRTRDVDKLEAAKRQEQTLVLDVGAEYNTASLNFDHHQDRNLKSAAGLIFNHFRDVICPKDAQPYFEKFINGIDIIDTNRDNIFALLDTLPSGLRNTSDIIGAFNRNINNVEEQSIQFNEALGFAVKIVQNELHNAGKKAESEAKYAVREILPNNIAVFSEYSAIWKEKKDHLFAIFPHPKGWQIQSQDTSVMTVPEDIENCEGFIFRHASGFLGVVKEKSVLLDFAGTFAFTSTGK